MFRQESGHMRCSVCGASVYIGYRDYCNSDVLMRDTGARLLCAKCVAKGFRVKKEDMKHHRCFADPPTNTVSMYMSVHKIPGVYLEDW